MAKKKAADKKSYSGCIEGIATHVRGDTQLAETILEEVDNIVQKNRAERQLSKLENSIFSDIDVAVEFLREAHLVEKRNAVLNARARRKIQDYVDRFGDNKYEGLMAYLGGSNKNIRGAKLSIDTQAGSLYNRMQGKLINQLQKDGILSIYTSGKFEDDIARELWDISNGLPPGVSKNKDASKIATAIAATQQELVTHLNRAGARIKNAAGYITRTSHDPAALSKAGFETWRDAIMPLLDQDYTFRGAKDPNKLLKEMYDNLVTGHGLRQAMDDLDEEMLFLTGMTGPMNLAKKLSESRVFKFKDADSWLSYNRQFGLRSLGEAIDHGIRANTKSIALMENLGTNPELMLDRVIRDMKIAAAGNAEQARKLASGDIEQLYKVLDGSASFSANHTLSVIGSGLRGLQNMTRLGASVLSSITDIPFQVAAMRNNGVSVLESYGNAFSNILRGRGDAEAREIASYVGVGFQGMMAWHTSRFAPEDNLPGKFSKLQQKMFTLNLMNWWNDAHTAGVANVMTKNLGRNRHLKFNSLPERLQTQLWRYDIGEVEWDAIRERAQVQKGSFDTSVLGGEEKTLGPLLNDTTYHISPESVRYITNERIASIYDIPFQPNNPASTREIRRHRDLLTAKLSSYFHGEVYTAIPHPDARINAAMTFKTRPGTAAGEAVRFLMQFKSFPLSAVTKGLMPLLQGSGSKSVANSLLTGKADYSGLAHFIAGTTIFGYLALTAKAFVKGQTPPDPTKWETITAALMQGGGLGLYGDFLFGEFNRFGNSALATLSGPVVGQAEDIFRMYSDIKDGKLRKAQGLRLLLNNVPGANLFYTRAAMDYLILYNLQEMASPGYLGRMERRLKEEKGQEFILPPSQYATRLGR